MEPESRADSKREAGGIRRRRFLAYFSSLGVTSTLLPGTLWARMQEEGASQVTLEMLRQAEALVGLEFTDSQRAEIVDGVNDYLRRYRFMRGLELANAEWPAFGFSPVLPGMSLENPDPGFRGSAAPDLQLPRDREEVAFWPVTQLARLIRTRRMSAQELARIYLKRLRRYDPKLHCVITLTEDRALEQAARADEEIERGVYRSPLHGIPWGMKDLAAVTGYPTTWGAEPYRQQIFSEDATVVERLDAAGAVLLAKLSTGELARGDEWFGGRTMNPWNTRFGTGGSSAGPAAATAAGLVGFALGTETRGSIMRPSTNCGLTGLRPTFGRVSRWGVMALTFTMDKVGPMCRSVEDCALVLKAIAGPDGKDLAVVEKPFGWDPEADLSRLRVGYARAAFGQKREAQWMQNDQKTLESLRSLGFDLIPVELPEYPEDIQQLILYPEAAAAFEELTLTGRDRLLSRQDAWPRTFRQARHIPAVEYVQAGRIRLRLMQQMEELMKEVDIVVLPNGPAPPDTPVGRIIPMTNLTGHPIVVVPNGLGPDGIPTGVAFLGRLYAEGTLLALAKRYQDGTGFHLSRPSLEA